MNTVHHKTFSKFFLKLNKMGQNFGKKIEIFENKLFVDKNDLIC